MPDHELDETPDDSTERWDRATREAAANAVGAFTGGLAHGPEGAFVGGTVAPYVLVALDHHYDRWRSVARLSAGRVLLLAAERLDESPEDVLRLASTPGKALLAANAFASAASTANEWKIKTLAHVLVDGLTSDESTKLDETAMILAALRDMEAPHVRVLAFFAERGPMGLTGSVIRVAGGGERELTDIERFEYRELLSHGRTELAERFPSYGVSMEAIVATLERHGLVTVEPLNVAKFIEDEERRRNSGFSRSYSSPPARWKLTRLGFAVFEYLLEEGAAGLEGPGSFT